MHYNQYLSGALEKIDFTIALTVNVMLNIFPVPYLTDPPLI